MSNVMTSEGAPNSVDHRENPSLSWIQVGTDFHHSRITNHAVIRQLFHGKILPLATLREVIARDIFKKVGFGGLVIQCLIFEAPVADSEVWYIVRISGP